MTLFVVFRGGGLRRPCRLSVDVWVGSRLYQHSLSAAGDTSAASRCSGSHALRDDVCSHVIVDVGV